MSVRKKTYGFLGLVAIFAVSAYLIVPYLPIGGSVSKADSSETEEANKDDASVPVEIAVAREGDISSSISSTANLRPKQEVIIASQTEGVVQQVRVEEGDFVKKGQVLCSLDDTQYKISLQTAKQKLAQANLQLEKARILQEKSDVQVANTREELDRYQSLYAEQLVSEREVAQVRYRMDELQHDLRASDSESRELSHRVEELEAEIEQSELEISRTRITAPFSGFITERMVNVGQTIRNMDSLFKLGDFSPLEADVFLSERDASEIVPGQGATVYSRLENDAGLLGRVARVSPVVDQSTGTVKVTVELAMGNQVVKPGAFVRVAIQTDTRASSVLVPKRAIIEDDGEKYVYVTSEDSAKRVLVTLGYENGTEIEILSGVDAGDSVVIAGQGGLKDGTKVKLVETGIAA